MIGWTKGEGVCMLKTKEERELVIGKWGWWAERAWTCG